MIFIVLRKKRRKYLHMTKLSAVADSDDRFKNDSQRQQMVLFSKNFMNYITSAILKLFMWFSWIFLGE